MKKLFVGMVFVAMVCVVGHNIKCNYTRHDCVVVQASETGVIFKDKCGLTWYVEEEGFKIGDVAHLKMYNNGTYNCIDDDKIKKVVRAN